MGNTKGARGKKSGWSTGRKNRRGAEAVGEPSYFRSNRPVMRLTGNDQNGKQVPG